ncbi:hypothetical protein [Bradyrhizobium tropiciagri]|uniref:hypothetical protein n=1 Tax=Bradyrhizobium tropiciagri TaxID=312253 RepID=UPI000A578B93|nr:hypothetical protein [Bradyrhizobium tropiciagri]
MYKDAIMDELRQELDVVEGEKRLADLEALLFELKRRKFIRIEAAERRHSEGASRAGGDA